MIDWLFVAISQSQFLW